MKDDLTPISSKAINSRNKSDKIFRGLSSEFKKVILFESSEVSTKEYSMDRVFLTAAIVESSNSRLKSPPIDSMFGRSIRNFWTMDVTSFVL